MKKRRGLAIAATVSAFLAGTLFLIIVSDLAHISPASILLASAILYAPTIASLVFFLKAAERSTWLSLLPVGSNAVVAAIGIAQGMPAFYCGLYALAFALGLMRSILMLRGDERELGFLRWAFGAISVSYTPPAWAARREVKRAEASPKARRRIPGLRATYGKASAALARLFVGLGARLSPFFDFKGRKSLIGYGTLLAIAASVLAFLFIRPTGRMDFSISPPGIRSAEEGSSVPPLRIFFDGSAARIDLVGKEVASGASIEPSIEGRWAWTGDREIDFFPSQDWSPGMNYRIKFEKSIFSDLVALKRSAASFSPPGFELRLASSEFYIDPTNPGIKRVVASFAFNYAPNRAQFEKAVKMSLPYSITYDDKALKAYLTSSPIPVPDKAYSASIQVLGSVAAAAGGPSFSPSIDTAVRVPGLYDNGSIVAVEASTVRTESYEYRKILVFSTSLGAKPEALRDAVEILLLPRDRPESPGTRKDENHSWSAYEIDDSVLALSQKLSLEAIPIETEYGKSLSCSFEAPSGRSVYVHQVKELSFVGDYRSKPGFADVLRVPEIKKDLKIMHDGSILAMSGEKTISLFSNDVDQVVFETGRIIPDQVNHLITQTGGDFKNPIFQRWDFGLDNISSAYTETVRLGKLEPGKVQYFSFDFDKYLRRESDPRLKYGLFYFKASEYDPATKKATSLGDRRLILVTDLGILVKREAQSDYDLFVQSVYTGSPVAGATVDVVGKNGLAAITGTTDSGGHVRIPSLAGLAREKEPVAFVVKKGSDMSFLPVAGVGRFLNYSRFDTGGLQGAADPGFIDAYLFSDRGIYRPGEEAKIGIVVKAGSWERRLEGLPLELSVEDPRGLEVQRRKLTLSASGFEEFAWRSLSGSQTGKYEVKLYVARDKEARKLLGSTSIKVEEFQPDRLSIRSRFLADPSLSWISPDDLRAEVDLSNLYGTPAAGNFVTASLVLSPAALSLGKFQDYRFYDPYSINKSAQEQVGETTTDEKGAAIFPIAMAKFDKGTYLLRFSVEGREKEGGRTVVSESSAIVSPLSAVVGYKVDGDLDYVAKGAARTASFVAVDPRQNRVALTGLTLEITESRYVSVLEKGPDGLYRYKSVEKKVPVSSRACSIGAAADLSVDLPTRAPGDFEATLSDSSGTRLSGFRYAVVGSGNLAGSLDKNAELQVKLDRRDYAAGDAIRVSIKAPYVGAGLLTIERDRVYAYSWFKTDTNATVQTIVVPDGLEGTAYVNVSFVRAIDSREIYASPLSYGVAPFSISRGKRTNKIELSAPDELRGGGTLKVKYSSQRPGKLVLFGADEGILQVAGYAAPQPLDHFFAKRALEVRTLQILDLILPEYSIVRAVSAAGGDDEGAGRNINPFKRKNKPPVAFWSGILRCDATERSFEYAIPDWFNGGIKIMAVLVSDDSMGAATRTAKVRNDYVISPNVPTTVSPGDEFEVGVRVLHDAPQAGDGITEVKVELKASPKFQVLKDGSRSMALKRGEEGTAYFRLRATDSLGEAGLEFVASGGGASSAVSESVSLRPAMPYRVELDTGKIVKGEKEIALDRKLHREFAKVEASASYLPTGMSLGLKEYLDDYPYGCTEQIVSRAFPAIALRGVPDFGVTDEDALESFKLAQSVLRARQNQGGNFGLWAANAVTSPFVTSYAMHFLADARDAGLPVDKTLVDSGLVALRNIADDPEKAGPLAAAYAAYALTRNGIVTTSYLNGILSSKALPRDWKESPVAAFIAGAYSIMRQSSEARALLASAFAGRAGEDYFFNGLAASGLCLYMAARHAPGSAGGMADKALEGMVAAIAGSKYNTISSSYAIMGLAAYAAEAGVAGLSSIELRAKGADGKYAALGLAGGAVRRAALPFGSTAVAIADRSGNPLYYSVSQAGFDLAPPAAPIRKGIEVLREFEDAAGKQVSKAKIGDLVYVRVKARTVDPKKARASDVAIVDLLPSGFELADRAGGKGSLQVSYVESREDRMLIFCDLAEGVTEYVYAIRATSSGSFAIPPAFAESMYDLDTWAMTPAGGTITVTGQ